MMDTNKGCVATTRRAFLGASVGASLSCLWLPSRLLAALEESSNASENDVVLRFVAMSDVHFNGDENAPEVDRLRRALKFANEYSASQPYKNFDALVVAGDVSNHGYDKEIGLFKKTMNEGLGPNTKAFLCMGNHEFWGGSKPLWEETFGLRANDRYEANGFQFVALSPEKGSMADGDYLYALDWFDRAIADACAADPNKPVFVFQHYHVTPTVLGTLDGDVGGTRDLYETLSKYPNVIDFSGHSHRPLSDPRSAWQGTFNAFGTATLSYFTMSDEGGIYDKYPPRYNEGAEFYVVEVRRDNSVVLKPYDLRTNSFFDFAYYVAKPGSLEKKLYTKERWETSKKPVWPEGAAATFVDAFANGFALEFPQATCEDFVHSYRAAVERIDENGAPSPADEGYFWSEYYFRDAPKTMRIEFDQLDGRTKYRGKIFARNPYFRESERSLDFELTTPNDPSAPLDKNAPKPAANMLDVSFADGVPVNAPTNGLDKQKTIQTLGAPKIENGAAIFDGIDDAYRIPFAPEDYRKIRRATIAVRFRFDAFPKANAGIFGDTEGSGFGFSLDVKTRRVTLWASVGGSYRVLGAPIEPSKEFVDAFGTFDGKNVVLYLNGKEVARQQAAGKLTYPTDRSAQAFVLGGDTTAGGANSFFPGVVESARLFGWALTPEQVANWSK